MPTDSDFQTVTAESLERIDEIFTLAVDFRDRALADVNALLNAATAHIALLDSETFVPAYDSSLDLNYVAVSAPSEPDYSNEGPSVPTLDTIPEVPSFSYSDTAYVPLLQTEMQTKLQSVLGGSLIVPTAIWDAIFERARGKLVAQQVGDEWDASNIGASLGWEHPSASTTSRLDKVQDVVSQQTISLIVEQSIAEARERHADLWEAIKQGTPFEGVWIGEHHQTQNRLLKAASEAVTRAVEINEQLIRGNDLLLRKYGLEWQYGLQHIAEATARYSALVQNRNVGVQSESARLGYQQVIVQQGLETEKGVTNLAIERTALAKVLVESLTQIANLMAAMTQGALAASDVSVGTGTRYTYSENLEL